MHLNQEIDDLKQIVEELSNMITHQQAEIENLKRIVNSARMVAGQRGIIF